MRREYSTSKCNNDNPALPKSSLCLGEQTSGKEGLENGIFVTKEREAHVEEVEHGLRALNI